MEVKKLLGLAQSDSPTAFYKSNTNHKLSMMFAFYPSALAFESLRFCHFLIKDISILPYF